MTIALSEFWTNLVHAGVLSANGCKQIAARCSEANDGRIVSDPVAIAKFMIQAGELTEFQARSLLSQPAKSIRFGQYIQQSESTQSPLSRWIQVQSIDDRTSGWLTLLPATQVDLANRQWLADHQRVAGKWLQPILCSASSPETIEVFSELPQGGCLFDLLAKEPPMERQRAVKLGVQIAQSLAILHGQGLVHGSVRADRVWVTDVGDDAIMLREPMLRPILGQATTQDFGGGPRLDDLELAEAYAAPELVLPTVSRDHLTDIYAAGCLLFRMVSGRLPFDAQLPQALMDAHAHDTPLELSHAVSQGAAGDPCFRVIAFAMAKNRDARIATADQLTLALQAVLPLLADKPATSTPTDRLAKQASVQRKTSTKSKAKTPAKRTGESKPQTKPAELADRPDVLPPARPISPPVTEAPPITEAPPAVSPPSPHAAEVQTPAPPAPQPPSPTPRESANRQAPAAEPPVAEPAAAEQTVRRRRKKKKSSAPLFLGALGMVALLLVVALLVYEPGEREEKKTTWRPVPTVIPSVGGGGVRPSRPDAVPQRDPLAANENVPDSRYNLIDDQRLLFVPPSGHGGEAAPLRLLPPGPSMIVSGRPASLGQSAPGQAIISLLGPELGKLIDAAASRAGVTTDEIDRCTAALHSGKDGWPEVSLAIELVRPKPLEDLLKRWQVSESRTPDGATVYASDQPDGDAYFLGDSGSGKVAADANVSRFAVGSVSRMREVADINGGEIPLPRAMEKLWRTSSPRADLVVLITPNFLLADGRSMLQTTAPQLVGPLKSFLIPDVASTQVMATVDDQRLYLELRMIPSGVVTDAALRERIRKNMQGWPKWADDFVVDAVPDTSWRLLANRLPSMMRFMVDHTRDGISDSTVIVNAYLPSAGAAQLSLATLLALNTPRAVAVASTTSQETVQPMTLPQMLDRKMSVAFDQESLEFAINTIVDEFQRSLPAGSKLPPVKIIGSDLQLMGITQNQQIRDFAKSDIPLRQVLTDLVVGANPDKTATGPMDPKQALLWVVVEDAEANGEAQILITTRSSAEGKYEIPAEFVVP